MVVSDWINKLSLIFIDVARFVVSNNAVAVALLPTPMAEQAYQLSLIESGTHQKSDICPVYLPKL